MSAIARLRAIAPSLKQLKPNPHRPFGSAAAVQYQYDSDDDDDEESAPRGMLDSEGSSLERGVQWVMIGEPRAKRHFFAERLSKLLEVPHISMISLLYPKLNPSSSLYDTGLIPAMQEVMPGVHHRYCAMHLWRNFTKQWKDKELRGVVWECAKATTPAIFNTHMERLKRKNRNAWEYLNKWPKEAWTKAHFSEWSKVDNITNNTCEVFNAKILKHRGKPILTMAEEIRCYIMKSMCTNKLKLQNRTGILCPMQQSRLDKEKIESNKWTPIWSGDNDGNRFEVQYWQHKMDVNLSVKTCTCRFWQLTGMPCAHAIAAIAFKNQQAEDYCHGWLTLGAYNATYNYFIAPTQGHEYWTQTEYEKPIPPPSKKRQGRPKRQRRKDSNEAQASSSRLKRKYPTITCSRCGFMGHNITGCSNVGVPTRPKKWKSTRNAAQDNVRGQAEIELTSSQPTVEPISQPTIEPATHPTAEHVASHSQLAYDLDSGKIVPEKTMFDMLSKRLEEGNKRGETGFILDGLPHTRKQAEILNPIACVDLVVNFKCPLENLMINKLELRKITSTNSKTLTKPSNDEHLVNAYLNRLEESKILEDYYRKQKKLLNFEVAGGLGETWQGLLSALHLEHINARSSQKLTA